MEFALESPMRALFRVELGRVHTLEVAAWPLFAWRERALPRLAALGEVGRGLAPQSAAWISDR